MSLVIKNLHANVQGTEILKGINLEIPKGEVHAIMGPNGSGKSTLSATLAGREDYEVTGGSVEFKGKDLLELARLDETKPLQLRRVDLLPLARDAARDTMAAAPDRACRRRLCRDDV